MKIVCFDFDGTLSRGETIEKIADPLMLPKLHKDLAKMNQDGIKSSSLFEEFYKSKVRLLEKIPCGFMRRALDMMEYYPYTSEMIRALKSKGWTVIVLSAGFQDFLIKAQEDLEFDWYIGNFLLERNDVLTGEFGGLLTSKESKGKLLRMIREQYNPECVIAVGDGSNDISMFRAADYSIATHSDCPELLHISTHRWQQDSYEDFDVLIDSIEQLHKAKKPMKKK